MLGVYRQKWGEHEQTGLVALASVEEYDRGIIKKHELTRPVKESDRVRIIEAHESQSGPVLLFFQRSPTFKNWVEKVTSTQPDVHFVADDTVEHTVWSVRDESAIQQIVDDFQAHPFVIHCGRASSFRCCQPCAIHSSPSQHTNVGQP